VHQNRGSREMAFNRTYHVRARRSRLQGEQLDISFPRRGRLSRFRKLERAGQMRLGLHGQTKLTIEAPNVANAEPETIDQALDYLFPVRPLTEDELAAEFYRLFPPP
jgi:hypothetical protein